MTSRKFVIISTSMVFCFMCVAVNMHAAVIVWDTPKDLIDETDIVTDGDLLEAFNMSSTTETASPVVNGVTFVPNGTKLPSNTTGQAFCTSLPAGPYLDLLKTLDWGAGATSMTVADGLLEVGKTYMIQIWYVDERGNTDAREEQFSGTGVSTDPSGSVNDQYVIGYFTADSTSQLVYALIAGSDPHANAYQIRELASGPVPTLSTTAGSTVSGNFTVNIDFTEAVTGLEESDISVINGTVMTSSLSGSGANWTVVIIPTSNGDVSVTLPADSVIDVDSEPNPESNTLVTTYVPSGSDQPIATLSTPLAEVDAPYTVQIDFTEAVTGLEQSDFLISNGILSGLSGSGMSYSILVTPISPGNVTLSLPRNSVTDTDGDNLQNPASNELIRVYSGARRRILYQDHFDNDSLAANTSGVGGGAVNRTIEGHAWTDDGDATFVANGTTDTQRALLYSENTFQSDTGFRLTVNYTTGSIGDVESHNLSFGLVSSDTDLATYSGYNPFQAETSVYSIGANVTADGGTAARGLNFTNGSTRTTLDESGTRVQFVAGASTKVYIEIGIGGSWQYRINDEYEAHGVLLNGFDPSKSYHVVVYGQDDNGGGKSIQSIKLESAPAAGERAAGMRGTWTTGVAGSLVDDRIKRLRTLDACQVRFSDGASLSAEHFAPNKFMETIALDAGISFVVAPSWGDLSLDEPENDEIMDQILNMVSAGFKVKSYSNSENFVGDNATEYQEFVDAWMDYCDTDPEVQAFIYSQPYHTKVWNRTTQQYDINGPANRKYMFCYAEYVLKEYALRYGPYIGSWIFDSAKEMVAQGDNATSGIIEEQRIYQAFYDAVHAGNPDIPVAYNNGRSTTAYDAYPFAIPKRFEDFTFGHAFGGNNDHAAKNDDGTGTFYLNYQHITRMTETDGYVFDGGNWDWDDLIVGNFHSKLSTTAWKYGPVQAWEQDDFNAWILEATQAGGAMLWGGSYNRSITTIYDWVYVMLEECDAYLMEHQNPDAPNWARAYTVLPDAAVGMPYSHTLVDGVDFWDPEGDAVTLSLGTGAPSWLTVEEDTLNPGTWLLHGLPTETTRTEYEFGLLAADASGATERWVQLTVDTSEGYIAGDLTSDGRVDLLDVAKLGTQWQSGYDINTLLDVANDWLLGVPLLMGHWPLDGNADDASVNGYHGTVYGDPAWSLEGSIGGAIELDGVGDYTYHPVDNDFVDGVFVPSTEKGFPQITSDGHEFKECPPTNNTVWGSVFNTEYYTIHSDSWFPNLEFRAELEALAQLDQEAIFMHANGGITFDLNRIRAVHGYGSVKEFRTGFLCNKSRHNRMLDVGVLVDGQIRYQKTDVKGSDTVFPVRIPISQQDQFLTLAITDGSDDYSRYNWGFFIEPVLILENN